MLKRLGGLFFLRRRLLTIWYALRDREASWGARLLALFALLYAASPVDFLPDVIPLLGWLDDLGVLGIATALLLQLTPAAVLERAKTRAAAADGPAARWMRRLLLVLALWLLVLLGLGGVLLWQLAHP